MRFGVFQLAVRADLRFRVIHLATADGDAIRKTELLSEERHTLSKFWPVAGARKGKRFAHAGFLEIGVLRLVAIAADLVTNVCNPSPGIQIFSGGLFRYRAFAASPRQP